MTLFIEQRDSRRFKLNAGAVRIEQPPILSPTVFEDISASGTRVVVPRHLDKELSRSPLLIRLGPSTCIETNLLPVRTTSENTHTLIGAKFLHISRNDLGSLSGFLAGCFLDTGRTLPIAPAEPSEKFPILIKKHKTLKKDLLRYYCIILGYPLEIHREGRSLSEKLKITDIRQENNQYLIYAALADKREMDLRAGQTCTFTFPGENAVHSFEAVIKQIEPDNIILEMPAVIIQSGFRYSLRSRIDTDLHVKVVVNHPRWPEEKLEKPLWDLGAQGFSFPSVPEKDMLFPGELIRQCAIHLPDGPVHIEGAIRSIRRPTDQWVYGVEILRFLDDHERNRWMCFVLKATHGRLKIARRKNGADFWRVLKKSEYIQKEVTTVLIPHIKKSFFRNWHFHAENDQVNRHLLLYQKNKPIAAASMNLLYPNTSLSHHVSIDRRYLKRFFDIGRELICGLQYVTRHLMPTQYYISYFYADKTYNDIMFRRFINRYPLKEDYVYDRYQLYKCQTSSAAVAALPSRNDIVIEDGNPLLFEKLSRHQRATLPPIEFEAFAYDESQIDLEAFSRQCLRLGYERKRRVFFAMQNQHPLAALIAESGDEGLNTFNLINCCWAVYLESEASKDHIVIEQLIARAVEFYREENKSEFILFKEHTEEPDTRLEKLGIKYITDGMRWIGNDRISSAYLHYVRETLGMLGHHLRPY